MNIYKRIFYPLHLGIKSFALLGVLICGFYLIIDAIPRLLSGEHTPWYKWALFRNEYVLREYANIIVFLAGLGAVVIGLPNVIRQYRYFARYCFLKGLKLRDLSHYSDEEIEGIKPFLEKLDDKSRVYFDEYVQEHYFEAPELLEILHRDRLKISVTQYYWTLIGKLGKDELLAKAKKKSRHPWFRPSNL